MIKSVVIVGAGQAGYHTAASLRHEGFDGAIVLLGDEPGLPYQRPPLSKGYLLGKVGQTNLCFRPAKFYTENKIDLIHDRATAIDRTNRHITLSSGATLAYDHLVLALGAHNRILPIPGADLDGVFGLRTLEDADRLNGRLQPGANIVVAGAGFIGMEIAATAIARGANVRVLELADRPMSRAVSPQMSAATAKVHESMGVKFLLRQGLAKINGAGRKLESVVTTSGETLPADTVIFGIGVLPNVRLASEAGLDIENGIKVDQHLLTSDRTISAIGDCAFFPSPRAGGGVRLESVQNATDQARAATAHLVGKQAPYDPVPWFWSDQYDKKLQIAGYSAHSDSTIVIGDVEAGRFSVLCFGRGQFLAVESLNKAGDHMATRRLLARGTTLSPLDAAAPGFDLVAWEAQTR